jgi:hypothetical protein
MKIRVFVSVDEIKDMCIKKAEQQGFRELLAKCEYEKSEDSIFYFGKRFPKSDDSEEFLGITLECEKELVL